MARHDSDIGRTLEIGRKVQDLTSKLDDLNYFELLGLGEKASVEEVRSGYLRAIQQYHPDRFQGLGSDGLAKSAERLVARMGEAAAVLCDIKKRDEYVRILHGAPKGGSARDMLAAEEIFKMGQLELGRGQFEKAVEHFSEATTKNPLELQYRAYLAWARYGSPAANKPAIARTTLDEINAVAKEQPRFARAFFWIGMLNKQLGDDVAAKAAFGKCLGIDKDFIEAARELRLMEMRRRNSTKPPPPTSNKASFLGRLFKR